MRDEGIIHAMWFFAGIWVGIALSCAFPAHADPATHAPRPGARAGTWFAMAGVNPQQDSRSWSRSRTPCAEEPRRPRR
jgi:hypothetical protein